jgi:hypothetical protein
VSDQFQSISVWRDRVSYACSIVIMSLNYTNTCTYRVNQDEPSPKAIMTYEDTYILPLCEYYKVQSRLTNNKIIIIINNGYIL